MSAAPLRPRDGAGLGGALPDGADARTRQRSGHEGLAPAAATPDEAARQRFEALLAGGAAPGLPVGSVDHQPPLLNSDTAAAAAPDMSMDTPFGRPATTPPTTSPDAPPDAPTDAPSDAAVAGPHHPPEQLRDGDRSDPSRQPDALPSPMALFSRLPEPAPMREPGAAPSESLNTTLALRIETLAISTEQNGHRRVRLSVADNALPDTDVELGHAHGELQVVFFCRRPEGRVALAAQAPQLADTLARRLQQVVSVSVGGAQRDEPGRVTVQAQPRAGDGSRGAE